MTQQDNDQQKPFKFPDAWPTDGCSKLVQLLGQGWVINHPKRDPMLFKEGRWRPLDLQRGVA